MYKSNHVFRTSTDARWRGVKYRCVALFLVIVPQPLAAQQAADQAFQGAQWIMASAASRAVAQVGARIAAGEGVLADTIRARQDLEARYLQLQKDQLADTAGAGADGAALAQQITVVSESILKIDRQLAIDFPNYSELTNPRPLDFKTVQQYLKPDEALILFLSDRLATYVWVVTKSGANWDRVELGSVELADAVQQLRVSLDPNAPVRSAEALDGEKVGLPFFDRQLAHDLYRRLLGQFSDLTAGVKHAFVVVDGALTSLPLAVLVRTPPFGDDDDPAALRETDWLAKSLSTTTLPGVSNLAVIRSGRVFETRNGAPTFVGFGDPKFGATDPENITVAAANGVSDYFVRGLGNVTAINGLSALPGTARELKSLARILGADNSTVFLGTDATEAQVKTSDLSKANILAFATHGLVTGELKGLAEPALVFTPPKKASENDDGLLTASEASELDISADWVILSACNTAAGDGTPGASGLSGLARAFLFAGARSVLVSHWPVRDDVASALTTRTLALLTEMPELGRSAALHQAMMETMADTRDPAYAHPSAWAPFVIVGEGG